MGFGTLFVSYLLSFVLSLNPYGTLFTLVGYAGMLVALRELAQYQRSFLYACSVTPLLILTAAYKSCELMQVTFGTAIPFVSELVTEIVRYAEYALLLIFHAALLYAIHAIACEIGLPRISRGAIRNAVAVGAYYLLYVIALVPAAWAQTYQKYMAAPVILLQLVWIGLNVWLIWMCYVHICKEGDEEVPLRVSRFAFVNKIRQEMERKEQKGIEATIEHAKKNRQEHLEGQAKNRELRIKYAERRDKMQKHRSEKKKKR